MLLSVCDGNVNQFGVFWLFCSSKNERRVGGSILRLVFANGYVMSASGPQMLQIVDSGKIEYFRALYKVFEVVGQRIVGGGAYMRNHLLYLVSFGSQQCDGLSLPESLTTVWKRRIEVSKLILYA